MQNHNQDTQRKYDQRIRAAPPNNKHTTNEDTESHPPLIQAQQPYSHSESLLPLWAVCVVALLSSL